MRLLSIIAASACVIASNAGAQPAEEPLPGDALEPVVAVADAGVRALTASDLEVWLDGFLPYALERGDIAGAVVTVVKDGAVLLNKGYGYADVEARAPVDPERTLFRPGSVSKLFTWTAVMQQVELGKIDLDADVNTYIDFNIPPLNGAPITMRHLMTHTPGFEEAVKDLIVEGVEPGSLGDTLKAWTPHRVYEAGGTPAYSNYATSLAGYIVERVSGEDFDTYLEKRIFAPLGMAHSSFRQPLPDALKDDMSEGYTVGSGKAGGFEVIAHSPAGALSSTGADMARFMIAHLQNGAFEGGQILKPETARQMHETAHTVVPPLNRMVLGFYEQNVNGRRVIAHGGDTRYFHSALGLFLDEGVGFYISVNSSGREGSSGAIRGAFFKQFSDRYFPGPAPDGEVDAATAAEHAGMMVGYYANSRRAHSSHLAALYGMGHTKVVATEDGSISVPTLRGLNGAPRKWKEIAPFVWRDVNGDERLAAVVENGQVVRFSIDQISPFMVFDRVPEWRSSAIIMPIVGAALAALVLTALLWPVRAVVRWRYRGAFGLQGPEAGAYRLVRLASWAALLTMAGWLWALVTASSPGGLSILSSKMDGFFLTLRVLSLVVFGAATAIALWNASIVWAGRQSWFAKLWSAVIALACLAILAYAVMFKLIGFGVNF